MVNGQTFVFMHAQKANEIQNNKIRKQEFKNQNGHLFSIYDITAENTIQCVCIPTDTVGGILTYVHN